jgi:hypothetical protein
LGEGRAGLIGCNFGERIQDWRVGGRIGVFLEDEAGELYGGDIVEDEVGGSGKRGGKEARFDEGNETL